MAQAHFSLAPRYDYVIVGAGLFGATFAYHARQAGRTCLVIDKRPQLGGNLFCSEVEGIHVHQYGAHIFHTSNREVWRLVNSIVEFNRYTNSPVANHEGRLYNLPFNLNTFHQMWGVSTPAEAEAKIAEQRAEAAEAMRQAGVSEPRNLEEQALMLVGKDIYERLVKGYTEKQWGRPCTALPAFIIKRLPVRLVFDNNYFNDAYQGIPLGGYNRLIDGLLAGADTLTSTDFFALNRRYDELSREWILQGEGWQTRCKELVFTGKIDEYFGYQYGPLCYRTVRFEHEVKAVANYQGNAVVNYTSAAVPYTRIIEHKHFESFGADVYKNPHTVISREYPMEWREGMEPYYPVNDEANSALYRRYQQLAEGEPQVRFGGRLAEYKYYDMAPIVERVINIWNNNDDPSKL